MKGTFYWEAVLKLKDTCSRRYLIQAIFWIELICTSDDVNCLSPNQSCGFNNWILASVEYKNWLCLLQCSSTARKKLAFECTSTVYNKKNPLHSQILT